MPLTLHVKFDETSHIWLRWINKVLKTSRNPAMFNSLSLKNNKKLAINLLFCLEKWQMGRKKVQCITVVHFSYPSEVQATEGDLLLLVTSFWPLHIHSALPAPPAVQSTFRISWQKSLPLCVCVCVIQMNTTEKWTEEVFVESEGQTSLLKLQYFPKSTFPLKLWHV